MLDDERIVAISYDPFLCGNGWDGLINGIYLRGNHYYTILETPPLKSNSGYSFGHRDMVVNNLWDGMALYLTKCWHNKIDM